jgi:hypothetical protein
LAAAGNWGEGALGPTQLGKTTRTLARDERSEALIDDSSAFLETGEALGLGDEGIVQIQSSAHGGLERCMY